MFQSECACIVVADKRRVLLLDEQLLNGWMLAERGSREPVSIGDWVPALSFNQEKEKKVG